MYPIKVGELFANVFNPRLLVIPYINLDDININNKSTQKVINNLCAISGFVQF